MNDDREDRGRENFRKKMCPTLSNGLPLLKKKERNGSDIVLASVLMQKDLRSIHLCTYNQRNPEQNEHYQLQNTEGTVQRASLAS